LAPGTIERNPVSLRLGDDVCWGRQTFSYTKSQLNKASDADFFFFFTFSKEFEKAEIANGIQGQK